jgi:cell division protein FtsA
MNRTEYVAALDIGTSKIVAMAARKNEKGILTILASEKEETENCIRRGYIYNADMTINKISRIIRRLNDQLRTRSLPLVEKIYVGIGGQSIHLEWYCIKKEIATRVDQELLDSIDGEMCQYEPEFAEILESLPPEFYVDGQLEKNPKGTIGSIIEARYPLIVNDLSLKKNLKSVLEEKINIAGFYVSPLATAEAVLTEENKKLGCALVEFGAGLTSLSIYRDGNLKYLVTIPLGASAITRDIASLNITEKEAEELKVKYGNATVQYGNDGKVTALEIAHREELKDFDYVIEARSDEIIANIKAQIEYSGYKSALKAGIIITGGGASLKDIATSIKQKISLPVSFAKNIWIDENNNEVTPPPEYATITGLLALGNVNCAKEVKPDKPIETTIFSNVPDTGKRDTPSGTNAPKIDEGAQKRGGSTDKKKKKGFIKWASESLFDLDNTNDNTEK